jgi:hypothetical protein
VSGTTPSTIVDVGDLGRPPTTDHGFTHTLSTPAGKLTVTGTGKQINTQTLNRKTCYFSYTSRTSGRACRGTGGPGPIPLRAVRGNGAEQVKQRSVEPNLAAPEIQSLQPERSVAPRHSPRVPGLRPTRYRYIVDVR